MNRNARRDVERLVKLLAGEYGCTVTRGRGGHWKASRVGRAGFVTLSHTPSDVKAVDNMLKDVRRVLGIELARVS